MRRAELQLLDENEPVHRLGEMLNESWMLKRSLASCVSNSRIEDIYEAARKCARAGIRITLNLILGYPGEDDHHRRETLRVMSDIGARYDNVSFSPNIFTPYPGIPIWPELKERGLKEPETLEAWSDVDLGRNNLPWLRGRSYDTLQRSISYFLLDNQLNKARRASRSAAMRSAWSLLRKPLHWRLRNQLFDCPVELWLSMARQWMVMRRSLLTGQPLSHELTRSA